MNEITKLHNQAMKLSFEAMVARTRGDTEKARNLYGDALVLERVAARLADGLGVEPTRSVLFRSAAWMAIWACLPGDAEALALAGLNGNPPGDIRAELEHVRVEAVRRATREEENGHEVADA